MNAVSVISAGQCTTLGVGVDDLWHALKVGRTADGALDGNRLDGLARLRAPDVPALSTRASHEIRRLGRQHLLALSAIEDALSRTDISGLQPDRVALVVGTGYGSSGFAEEQLAAMHREGSRGVSPLFIPLTMPNTVAARLSIDHQFHGIVRTICNGCASGASAVALGLDLIRSGRADVVVAGGVDSLVDGIPFEGFARIGAMSPSARCRPFDRNRDGFVMGEGAAFVVLTRASDAGNHRCLGTILGYAENSDGYHLVSPEPGGERAAECVRLALKDANLSLGDVGYVNAHGTGTTLNDAAEASAIRSVFGGEQPAVSSVKGLSGHMIGCSGVVEVIATLRVLAERSIPPTWGLEEVDTSLGIDVVHTSARSGEFNIAVSNSFAFGGQNVAIVLGTSN